MSLNKVLNRPMFRQQALRKGHIKVIKAQTGEFIGPAGKNIKAIQEQLERDKENTTLARFIRNLESRIYAQLSRQLVENLFGETPSTEGTLTLEGNTIQYSIEDGVITLIITDENGNVTEIQLPIGDFSF